jgi:chromate transporter
MNDDVSLGWLFSFFFLMSLMAIGGASIVVPDVHRQFVEVNRWVSGAEFAALYAISQAAPGPNAIFMSLMGWRVAGIPGALVATLGMVGPSSVAMFFVQRVWHRFRDATWRKALQRGLAPVAIGMLLASGYVLVHNATRDVPSFVVAIAAAAVAFTTRINYFWIFAVAGAFGVLRGA